MPCCFVAIDIVQQLQDVTPFCHSLWKELRIIPLGQFHVEWEFHRGLCISLHKIYLSALPSSDDCQDEEEADGLPRYHWGIHFPVIDALLLLPTMHIELCLQFVDLTFVNLSLASHSPHHIQHSCDLWHFMPGNYLPVLVSNVILQLFVHGPFELVSIGCLHCFMKVHDVCFGTRRVRHGLLHLLLYLVLPLSCWGVFCLILADQDFPSNYPLFPLLQPFQVMCCVMHYSTAVGLSLLVRVFQGCV